MASQGQHAGWIQADDYQSSNVAGSRTTGRWPSREAQNDDGGRVGFDIHADGDFQLRMRGTLCRCLGECRGPRRLVRCDKTGNWKRTSRRSFGRAFDDGPSRLRPDQSSHDFGREFAAHIPAARDSPGCLGAATYGTEGQARVHHRSHRRWARGWARNEE